MQENRWQEIVTKEVEMLASLPQEIADSWRKCYQENVDPLMNQPRKILSVSELKDKQEQHHLLIDLVSSEVATWDEFGEVLQPLYILTDSEGTILWRNGSYQIKDYANQIYFKEGSCWTDNDVGTNAIGLALTIKKQVFVGLKEHYAYASKNWSCAASPIFNENNEVLGILNISTYQNESVKESLMSLRLITESISNQLFQKRLAKKMKLLQKIQSFPNSGIICDTEFKVVNVSPKYKDDFFIDQDIREAINTDSVYESQKIYDHKEIVGYMYLPTKKRVDVAKLGIESQNETYQAFFNQTLKYANSSLPIHIYGESGTGKEITAKTIHQNSPYANGPLISLNCGALNEQLLESELFGYAPGAFTGARSQGYQGKIDQADGGTLFLDEIDSMSLKMQQTLLRVLEDKLITPINGQEKYVDFRIVTASNKKLEEQVIKEDFREDLFYRLVVCHVAIPSLRNRPQDFNVLIEEFISQKDWKIVWQEKLEDIVKHHQWPGNIREFNNFLERVYLTYQEEEPTLEQLWQLVLAGSIQKKELVTDMKNVEDDAQKIIDELKQSNYHLGKTAEALAISRTTLYRKMKKYDITI